MRRRFVVDASVLAAAMFQEAQADRAGRLLAGRDELHAPDFVLVELANVIWKRHGRREIDDADAAELLADLNRLPLLQTPAIDLLPAALETAMHARRSIYDCLYLALAVQRRAVMVTADRRLANALAGSPLDRHILWIGDPRFAALIGRSSGQ